MLCVLQVVPELDTGGVERTTIDIAAAVAASGGRALVASRGGRLEDELAFVGGELIRMPAHAKDPGRLIGNALALARIARRENVTLLHARSRAPAWSALAAARLSGRPLVTTYHGTYNWRSALKRAYNSVMARGDEVIANSQFIADHIRATHPGLAPRLTVIPRGADLAALDPAAVDGERVAALRDAWGLDADPTMAVVLLPGRLTRWKGQEVAVDALAGLRDRGGPPAVLVLAGDDQGRTEFRNQLIVRAQEKHVSDMVRVVGHCRDMPAAYALADVVVSASLEPEAFGRVAVEAQAMGRPVIATDHGGARETVRDPETGVLTPPGDAGALAEALMRILHMSAGERMAMGERGAQWARATFSVQAMQAATLAVYDRVAEAAA